MKLSRRKLLKAAPLTLCGTLVLPVAWADAPQRLPSPTVGAPASAPLETAVLAGGCFWGVQAVFQHVRGVRSAIAGYAGGERDTAHYHQVSTGKTGHAESVEIRFDPHQISYAEILRLFFSVAHDPTQLDRQGPDVGPQYRSSIFYLNAEQEAIARAYIAQLAAARVFTHPIATRLAPMKGFFRAEEGLQDFVINYPASPYVVLYDLPKVQALWRLFPEYYRPEPVRAGDTDP